MSAETFLGLERHLTMSGGKKPGALEEVELKLELTGEAADALEAADLFACESLLVRQHDVYFDTPQHCLARAGLSLRIRRVGRKRVQTIKSDAGAAAGFFIREEWERRLEDNQPVLDDTTPIRAVLGDSVAALAPLFRVESTRRIWQLDGIEIALDRGRIFAGGREAPVCEVELEQKGGDLSALFALARRIAAVAAVQLSVLSKSQRGYRLLGPLPGATKAGSIALSGAMTAAEAFQMIAHACMVQFRLNEPLVIDNGDPAALHQARVALRRLRAACSIHKTMLADGKAAALGEDLRWLGNELGLARDLDVLIDRLDAGPLRERLSAVRVDACVNAAHVLQSRRARALMIDLAQWLAIGDWRLRPDNEYARDLPARKVASEALDRYFRKLRKGGRDLKSLDDAERHEVRKLAKKLNYSADFFAALFVHKAEQRRHERFVKALKALLEQLGTLNDLATAPVILARHNLGYHSQAATLFGVDERRRIIAKAVASYDDVIDAAKFWR